MIQIRNIAFFIVLRQYAFPTVLFSDEEFINQWKADYFTCVEMYFVYLVRIFKESLTKVVENHKVGPSLSSAKRAMI